MEKPEFISELLDDGWIILKKDGIIKKVKPPLFGSIELYYRDGQPWKETVKVDNLI